MNRWMDARCSVCCSMVQCGAVCCSVVQYVAVCCIVLQCATVCCNMLQRAALFAVCCSVMMDVRMYVRLHCMFFVEHVCIWNKSVRTYVHHVPTWKIIHAYPHNIHDAHLYTSTHVHTWVLTHIYAHTWTHLFHSYIHPHACVSICIYVCAESICIHLCVCMCAYTNEALHLWYMQICIIVLYVKKIPRCGDSLVWNVHPHFTTTKLG